MSGKHGRYVDFHRLAGQGEALHGVWPVAGLTLVHDRLADSETGAVAYHLEPRYRDLLCAGRIRRMLTVTVRIRAEVVLTCRRTLVPFSQCLESETCIVPVADDAEAAVLPDDCEPVIVDAGQADVRRVLAEELLLALPLAPLAPEQGLFGRREGADWAAGHRPFAGLSKLF